MGLQRHLSLLYISQSSGSCARSWVFSDKPVPMLHGSSSLSAAVALSPNEALMFNHSEPMYQRQTRSAKGTHVPSAISQ